MLKVVYFATFLLFIVVEGTEYSQKGQGYHRGIMPDCPGSWKPAEITPQSLKKLKLSILMANTGLTLNVKTYTYYTAKKLANHNEMDFNKKTVVYVPGYLDLSVVPVKRSLVGLYKELGYNVLILDYEAFTDAEFPVSSLNSTRWEPSEVNFDNNGTNLEADAFIQGNKFPNLFINGGVIAVARLIRPVGKHVAEMLSNLTALGLDPKKLELVGLSLGGQLISFIAKNYREITGRNISSLTALDPAGRCFRHLGPDQRLDPSDADFVLSIATNMDELGMATPVGHVTFYVNGGEFQPGDIWWIPCDTLCSHVRSYFLWLTALLHPGNFIGMQCDSIQQARNFDCFDRKPLVTNTMDLYTDRSKPGIYYLSTSHKYPYYLGKAGVKRNNNRVLMQLRYLNEAEVMLVK